MKFGVSRLVPVIISPVLLLADAQQPSPAMGKAVEEFKVQSRALGLREDAAGRKRRNGSAKPAWHGRIFENLRNDLFDAVPHEITQGGGSKSLLRRNQFGFNVTGPLYIPRIYDGSRRTFFSVSYEGVRERISRSYLRDIPLTEERSGDFSPVVDQAGNMLPVFDPASTRLNPAYDASQPISLDNLQYVRDPFPNNVIPANRLDPVAVEAVKHYPQPNTSIGPFFQNNYFVVSPEENTANGMIFKLDHTISDRNRISIGTSFSNGFAGAAWFFPTPANPGAADRSFSSRRVSFEHVVTFSPRTLNTFGFEAASDRSETVPEEGEADALKFGGFPGGSFPVFRLGSYLSMGRSTPVSSNARNTYSASDSYSTRHGKHNVLFSGSVSRYQVNVFSSQYPAGALRFGEGLTSLPGIINTGHAFASFMLGMAEFAEATYITSPSYFRRSNVRVGFRERYEATPGLNFTASLYLDVNTPRVEKYNRQSTVDFSAINPANGRPGALVSAGRDGEGSAFQPLTARLEPSASMSWNLGGDSRSVFRASFARSYAAIPVYSVQFGTQGFNGAPTYLSPNVQLDPALRLSDGLPPPPPLPDLRPDAANDTVADLTDRSDRLPTYQSGTVSFERELPASLIVTLGISYSGGKNLLVGSSAADPNAIPLDALRYRDLLNDEDFNRSLRPFPQYKAFEVYYAWPIGRYEREEGFLTIEKRSSMGLSLRANYGFAKQMDNYSGPYGIQDYYNRDNEWSMTAGSNPHRFSMTYMYELPMGPNRPLLNYSDWRRYLIEGWAISGMTSVSSGEPLALRPQFNNTGGVVRSLRVNVVPGVDPHVSNPTAELWFNPAAFSHPDDFSTGNASRTHPTLRGPLSQNHDLSLTKRFALATDRTLELSAVGFNFLNHANWTDPDTQIGPESAPNVNAGKIIGSRGGRVIQLGLRLSF